jgi:hypothetical protein
VIEFCSGAPMRQNITPKEWEAEEYRLKGVHCRRNGR